MAHFFEVEAATALDAEAAAALRTAVGAATMLGTSNAEALLKLSDEMLGQLFKAGIAETLPIVERANGRGATRRAADAPVTDAAEKRAAWDEVVDDAQILEGRRALVARKELISAADALARLGISRQSLHAAVKDGRMFTVDVGATAYFPAFYVQGDLDRKHLSAVTRLLGKLPGWSKWQFFTRPKASLGKVTPLEALADGKIDDVKEAAEAFAER
jgi:hypothetical protein